MKFTRKEQKNQERKEGFQIGKIMALQNNSGEK